jgi:hypothetical protein
MDHRRFTCTGRTGDDYSLRMQRQFILTGKSNQYPQALKIGFEAVYL